ncbi:MAG TPA: hypothetical protein PK335_13585 [Draconibacterium sp.]|nr:hypothetical protein [Draconibacterium sp.]
MYKIYFLLGILVLFISSCNQPSPVTITPSEIILQQSNDVLPISSFAESVDYLELKLDQVGISLGEVEAVKQIDDDWIIQHRMSGQRSFIRFNRHGDFIAELAGEKMKEIIEPEDIIAFDKGYAVLAKNGVHLISKDGKYIRKFVTGNQTIGSRFLVEEGHFYILNEKLADRILVEAGDAARESMKEDVLPLQVQRTMYANSQTFSKTQSYFSVLSDSIYRHTANDAENVTKLTGNGIPTFAGIVRNMRGMEEKDGLKYLRETNYVMVRKYLENNQLIYLTYWIGSVSSTFILNKANGTFHYFGQGVNDIDGGIWDRPLFLTSGNDLVIPLTAYKISGHKISNKKVKGFDRLQAKIASDGNPVLMLCKLK